MRTYFGAPSHLRKPATPAAAARVAAQPSESQARCDAIMAEFRAEQSAGTPSPVRREAEPRKSIRRDPPPLPPALKPTDDVLKLRLAEELEFARRMLDQMGDALSADPAVLMRHSVPLQSVDIVGQIMGHIAAVIRSSDPEGAVERIGMAELRGRLTRNGGVE